MSESISNGRAVDLPINAGDSIKLNWLGGTFSVVAIAGLAGLPAALATNSAANASLGPWPRNIVVRVSTSPTGRVEYSVGNPPLFGEGIVGDMVVISADAPSNSDGRPENTIYIQA